MLRVYSIFLRLFVVRHITDFVHEIDHDVGLPQNVRRAYTDFTIDGENNYWTSGDPERSIFCRGGVLAWRLRLFRAIFAVSQVLNSGVDKQLADCLRHLPSVSMPENEHSSESAAGPTARPDIGSATEPGRGVLHRRCGCGRWLQIVAQSGLPSLPVMAGL